MAIVFKEVNYSYQSKTPNAFQLLKNVSFRLTDGSFTALIGQTGSGKTTLLKHINGLLKPSSGQVLVGDQAINARTSEKDLADLRKRVGFLFQFPETQLFAPTVLEDVAFGPENFGQTKSSAEQTAKETLNMLGFDMTLANQPPINLSGGQQRLAALAGVLATEPQILLLDEPTAGLDPSTTKRVMTLFKKLQQDEHLTILMATHDMDAAAEFADQILLMQQGKLVKQASPKDMFQEKGLVFQKILALPKVTAFASRFTAKTGYKNQKLPISEKELISFLQQALSEEPLGKETMPNA
ncbi:ATP-binding cassette domain-containing protein [Oenococcus kitaharae]|uniref:ECF transporter ATPase component n=1 Tax=Oenococcus kitaharae DSM 17330 TaxID=1045004 RepID=G9WG69_9LACO|nr:ATP-binding cassette domain-containing protein [Oenococcus kitaharae]EHN59677.1 ECF transporter ATPase component [Oenococcus kitaharae DSM 17330]OEY83513.1 cobalt ABC transporter [Oenococcus kitaharae]OEY85312.1 cobalt ABC transporter [Oenococcus kitaharae]OEY86166.1 cobalt ABC transporter [Oenococcus kitaharae]